MVVKLIIKIKVSAFSPEKSIQRQNVDPKSCSMENGKIKATILALMLTKEKNPFN
jgi:hypothetical protein